LDCGAKPATGIAGASVGAHVAHSGDGHLGQAKDS